MGRRVTAFELIVEGRTQPALSAVEGSAQGCQRISREPSNVKNLTSRAKNPREKWGTWLHSTR